MSVDPTTAEWLDGPGLIEWLEAHGGLEYPSIQLGTDERRVNIWRAGGKANVFAADRVLCRLGVCLGELPDELWTTPPLPGGGGISPEKAEEMVRRVLEAKEAAARVARDLGCDPKTVRRYVRLAVA